jgi:hypothetical protein
VNAAARFCRRYLLAAVAIAFAVTFSAYAQSAARNDPAATPTPRLGNRPDLNGTWDTDYYNVALPFVQPQNLGGGSVCVTGCGPAAAPPAPAARGGGAAPPPAPDFPKYKAEFLAKVKDLDERQVRTDSVLRCEPPGVPRIGPPHKIVQSAREVVFFYDDVNGGLFRIIPIDGRPHRKGIAPSYLGDAVGRWDGDTLVVETINFNEDTWLTDNGAFHTKDLRVIERVRRAGDTIEYQATAHDPAVLAEPWSGRPRTLRLTNVELEESARCEDRSLAFMQDGSHHVNPR